MALHTVLDETQTVGEYFYLPAGGPHIVSIFDLPASATVTLQFSWLRRDPAGEANWADYDSAFTADGAQEFTASPDFRYRVTASAAGAEVAVGKARPATIDRLPTAPTAPRHLRATVADAAVTLAWDAPEDDGGTALARYEYREAVGDAAFGTWTTTGGTTTTLARTGLTNDTIYGYEVRAAQWAGNSPAAAVAATPAFQVPGAPTVLTATAGDGQVGLTWTAPANNGGTAITGYEYQVTLAPIGAGLPDRVGAWTPTGSASAESTVTGLDNRQEVRLAVRAVNEVGAGPATGVVTVNLRAPKRPTAVTPTAGNTEIALTWTAPDNTGRPPITDYQVRVGPTDGESGEWAATGSTDAAYTISSLENGTAYRAQVRAVNVIGPGDASAAVTATPTA